MSAGLQEKTFCKLFSIFRRHAVIWCPPVIQGAGSEGFSPSAAELLNNFPLQFYSPPFPGNNYSQMNEILCRPEPHFKEIIIISFDYTNGILFALINRSDPNLKLGKLTDDGNSFEADIVTKDNSLVDKILVDKNTGAMRSAY